MSIDLSDVTWDAAPAKPAAGAGRGTRDAFEAALAAEGVTGKVADIARSIYMQESGGGKNTKTSNAGAVGGMQILPATFSSVADKGWDIADPIANARAGIRYVKQGFDASGGDPALTGAFYYGGPGGLAKAKQGVAVSDPRNPGAPTTLQYGQQVAARIPKEKGLIQRGVEAVIPSAQAAQPAPAELDLSDVKWDEPVADVPRVEVRGTAADAEKPGMVASLGAGLGKGVGTVALGAQGYLGKGLSAIGAETAGQWLQQDATAGRAKLTAENAPYKAANPITNATGEIGGEIISTLPVGGVLGAGAKAVGATRLGTALTSGGMTVGRGAATGGQAAAQNMLLRMAGGGITGGASAALVDPDSAEAGALIGMAAPPVISGVGKGFQALGSAYRELRTPQKVQLANKIAELAGVPVREVEAALSQAGPSMLPGHQQTVPQILQNPAISQLQRTLKTANTQALGDVERAQQGAYRSAIERVAPVDISVNDAATRAGSAIQNYAVPARAEATKRVSGAFNAVDPFNETGLVLPLKEMEAQQAKYLGRGTFGTGGKTEQALKTAREVGTEALDAVTPSRAATARNSEQTMAQFINRAGGINATGTAGKAFGGELKDLKQSGLRALVKQNGGQSLDKLAERLHAAGYIDDSDPATLLNALREGGGKQTATTADAGRAYQALREAAQQGDAPGAMAIDKAVPFQTVQNLRSSIGEAAQQAKLAGNKKEAAALRGMVDELDTRISAAAAGDASAGNFPKDVADQYRKALKMHAEKMQRFETGPQTGIFRQGGDGQPLVQGGEIPGKFYSGRASQVDDVKSLKRLVGDRGDLMQEMKRYAVTEGAATANQGGDLGGKFTKWLLARSGANRELFTEGELATLKEVGKAVQRSLDAENLGRVGGSDTAQKLEALKSLGLLDNKLLDMAANKIPIVRSVSGPALGALRESAGRQRNNALAQLLANPEEMAAALRSANALQGGNAISNAMRQALPLTYRAAPLIGAQ